MKKHTTFNISGLYAISPCGKCEKRGCGVYHDKCKEYLNYLIEQKKLRKKRDYYFSTNKKNVYLMKKGYF